MEDNKDKGGAEVFTIRDGVYFTKDAYAHQSIKALVEEENVQRQFWYANVVNRLGGTLNHEAQGDVALNSSIVFEFIEAEGRKREVLLSFESPHGAVSRFSINSIVESKKELEFIFGIIQYGFEDEGVKFENFSLVDDVFSLFRPVKDVGLLE